MLKMYELINSKGEVIEMPYEIQATLGNDVYERAMLLYQDIVHNQERYSFLTDNESITILKDGRFAAKYPWYTWIHNHLGLVDYAHYMKENGLTIVKNV